MAPGAPLTSPPAAPRDPGRSLRWRAVTALAGALVAGAGLAVILWPAILAYAVGGAIAVVGVFLVVTAIAARGR